MAAPAPYHHSCHQWSLCLLMATLSWTKGMPCLIPSLGPDCSGFPPLHILVLTCQAKFPHDLGLSVSSVWNTGVCLSFSPLACTSPFQCSLPSACAPSCHPWGGGVLFYFFIGSRTLPQQSPQGQASSLLSVFLYLGCSGYWTGTVTETQFHTVEPPLHWGNWKWSGEHWVV